MFWNAMMPPLWVNTCACLQQKQKNNGYKYPPATIRSLLGGINCTLQENKVPFSIFDKQIIHFCDLCNMLDVVSMVLLRCNITLAHHCFALLSKLVTLLSTIECMRVWKICERPWSSYKSPHSNIDSLDSLEGSTESLVSSVSTQARLSEISSHR